MLRRLLDSPWPYFVAAGVLLVLAIASQFEVQFPARSQGAQIEGAFDKLEAGVVLYMVDFVGPVGTVVVGAGQAWIDDAN